MQVINKLAKKPVWAVEKAYLWSRSICSLRKRDVIFSFYPKTGSTWVRIILFNLLKARSARTESDFDFDVVNSVMPEFANKSFFNAWQFQESPRMVKTHQPFWRFFGGHKIILFIREPRDTMISYLHYANAKKEIGFSGDLLDMIIHPKMGLDAYFRFYRSWLPHAGLVIRFEDLSAEPMATIRKLVDFIGIDASDEEIAEALEASSLEKTREAQSRSSGSFKEKFKEGFVFARSGQSGEGKEVFDQNLEEILEEKRAAYAFTLYQS